MTFFDTSEQQCKDAFIKAGFWPNEVMWSAWEKAWKLGADAKSEELRKQEPFGNLFPHNGPYNGFCISAPIESLKNAPYGMKLYAAPIPPDNHDWKAEYLRQVDLHNQTLDELREAEMQLRNPAPTPPTPTPSQQEALDALDNMDDYARMAGLIAIGPIETLRDFILARPDTEGSKHE